MKKGAPGVYLVWRVFLDLRLPRDGVHALSAGSRRGSPPPPPESSAPALELDRGRARSQLRWPITERFTFSSFPSIFPPVTRGLWLRLQSPSRSTAASQQPHPSSWQRGQGHIGRPRPCWGQAGWAERIQGQGTRDPCAPRPCSPWEGTSPARARQLNARGRHCSMSSWWLFFPKRLLPSPCPPAAG